MTDLDLVRRLLGGDNELAEEVVREHGPYMLGAARRILGSDEEARDCVQSAFIKAWKGLDGFRGEAALGTWLHRIVVNEALLAIRTRKRLKEESLEDLLPHFDASGCRVELPASRFVSTSADRLLEIKEVRQRVRAAIDKLPEHYRLIVVLRDIEGMSTSEAADALELSPGNVKVRLHRARTALKSLLEPVLIGEIGEAGDE